MSADLLPLLALNALPKVGPIRIRRLLNAFGTPASVLAQSPSSLQRVAGVGPEVAAILANWKDFANPDEELTLCKKEGISVVTPKSPLFPRNLKSHSDAPLLLYVRGEITAADQHAIAIVGSRRCTHYGRNSTRSLGSSLARLGYTIISGLARGIDTEAHEAALAANGRTIAILGSGLLNLYPSENRKLAERIADGNGAIVSEFPLRCPPDRQTFPQRNRIVAHWSRGLLVTECPRRSGSLITANMASDAGRPVFAVPGPIDQPHSEGCHDLIREGATLVTHAQQIVEDLEQLPLGSPTLGQRQLELESSPKNDPTPKPRPPLSANEEKVFQQLDSREQTMDRLAELTSLPIHVISSTLLALEMKGQVKQMAGQRYVRLTNL